MMTDKNYTPEQFVKDWLSDLTKATEAFIAQTSQNRYAMTDEETLKSSKDFKEKAAREYACDGVIPDSYECESCYNIYGKCTRDAFLAGYDSRQSEVDELVGMLRELLDGLLNGLDYFKIGMYIPKATALIEKYDDSSR